jgi:Domain of unknown function (DUF1707)
VAYGPAQAYPPQPPVPGGSGDGTAGINPAWLAASADRERAVGVLRAGFTEGRLTQEELDDRVAQAYAARTYGQLWALTADLPAGALPYPQFPQGPGAIVPQEPASPSHWKPAAALIITALVIFTLAALITAIITAHSGQAVYIPNFQQAHLTPFIKAVPPVLPSSVVHAVPISGSGG